MPNFTFIGAGRKTQKSARDIRVKTIPAELPAADLAGNYTMPDSKCFVVVVEKAS